MDLGRLDDRARRRDKPVEPLRGLEPGDRPGRGVTCGDALDRLEMRPDGGRVEVGREGREASFVEPVRAPMNGCDRQSRITPAFSCSPRSTRGTTRTIAYWKTSRGGAGTLGILDEGSRRLESQRQIADVGATLRVGVAGHPVVRQPVVRERGDQVLQQGRVDPASQSLVGLRDGSRERQQDVVGEAFEPPPSVGVGIASTCGGRTARRRGRSATCGRARRAGSGSAPSGPGW